MGRNLYEILSLNESGEVQASLLSDENPNLSELSVPLHVGHLATMLELKGVIFPYDTDRQLITAVMYHQDSPEFVSKTVNHILDVA